MLFSKLVEVAGKYPNNYAVNYISFNELLNVVKQRKYNKISLSGDSFNILLDILTAAYLNKPLVITPLDTSINSYELPILLEDRFGLYLYSSGTLSKVKKPIYLPEEMIMANANYSILLHGFTNKDNVLTVCSMNHTGGINAQTIPALLSGSHVIIEKFNIRKFFILINQHQITFTHLVPRMIDSLIGLRCTPNCGLLKAVTAGSDCIGQHHVNFFLQFGIKFYTNYGLTQAGPIIINHCFTSKDQLELYNNGIVLGTKSWVNTIVEDGELLLQGDSVNSAGWLRTDDCVEIINNCYYYKGRKSAGCKVIPKAYS